MGTLNVIFIQTAVEANCKRLTKELVGLKSLLKIKENRLKEYTLALSNDLNSLMFVTSLPVCSVDIAVPEQHKGAKNRNRKYTHNGIFLRRTF